MEVSNELAKYWAEQPVANTDKFVWVPRPDYRPNEPNTWANVDYSVGEPLTKLAR